MKQYCTNCNVDHGRISHAPF